MSRITLVGGVCMSRITLVGGVCNPDVCGKQRALIVHNALKRPKTEWL